MVTSGLIEKAETPTEWCTSIVIMVPSYYPILMPILGFVKFLSQTVYLHLPRLSHHLEDFVRLHFQISSAPEIFQPMEGVICHFDDGIVFGKTLTEHDARLRKVLIKLREEGWTLNLSKCSFRTESVSLQGHVVTKDEYHTRAEESRGYKITTAPK
ncbi:hypothetical protein PR048_021441 [Dryococelus australis]|uniref:Reverse transcriptase n=1 Tax=Dryococelus australis TaxID=614101 RepID=A0ABQ9GY97_9NEOP|nr:hypothetical protein PR048_021441 [Dryococelus australis]